MEQYSLVSEITSLSILHEGMGGVGGEGGEGGSHYKDKTALATLQPSLFLFDDIPWHLGEYSAKYAQLWWKGGIT